MLTSWRSWAPDLAAGGHRTIPTKTAGDVKLRRPGARWQNAHGVIVAIALMLAVFVSESGAQVNESRPRARELGVRPGIFTPGPANAITDVAGVRVGHTTIVEGDSIRTGVTAILPHGENPFLSRVPAAIHVGNGFGKLLGVTQVRELGELESPVLLTCTLCVWRVADAAVSWMLEQPGMERVGSINPLVGETNDGTLNAIRARGVRPEHVRAAIENATNGHVAEGAVGAGAGTIAFGWKGGIGTSSRVLPASLGGYSLGVLVQSNFGGILQMAGAPIGQALGQYAFRNDVEAERGDGSIMMVVATDAPLSDRNLQRIAARAIMGLSRTGSSASNGSGDYVIAFSTAESVRRRPSPAGSPSERERTVRDLQNDEMSALFQATVEATEEAIYNSMLKAVTVTSRGRTIRALPIDSVRAILSRHGISR